MAVAVAVAVAEVFILESCCFLKSERRSDKLGVPMMGAREFALLAFGFQVDWCFKIRVNFVIGREQSSMEAQCLRSGSSKGPWLGKRWPTPGKHKNTGYTHRKP